MSVDCFNTVSFSIMYRILPQPMYTADVVYFFSSKRLGTQNITLCLIVHYNLIYKSSSSKGRKFMIIYFMILVSVAINDVMKIALVYELTLYASYKVEQVLLYS